MDSLSSLIESGRIADIILVVMAVEFVVSVLVARRRNINIDLKGLFFNIGAGASLALALRASLTDSGWQTVAAFLVLSLVFHVADVGRRWMEARPEA